MARLDEARNVEPRRIGPQTLDLSIYARLDEARNVEPRRIRIVVSEHMINPNFVFIGVALELIGGWSYFIDTVRGKVQPNKVTWLLWSIAPLIAFFAMIKQGVGIVSLVTFSVAFVPLVIFIASFVNKKATWNIGKLDIVCGTLSVIGLILWMITRVGNIAIFFSIFSDALAALPTIVKSYRYPETENSNVYLFGVFNSLIGLLTITEWNFQNYGFPLYLFLLQILLVGLIRFKGANLHTSQSVTVSVTQASS